MRELVRAHTQVRGSPSAHAGRCEHALSCEAARERAPRVAVPEPRRSGGVTVTGGCGWAPGCEGLCRTGPRPGQCWLGSSGTCEPWGRVRGWRLGWRGARGGGVRPVDVAVHPAARCVLSCLDPARLDSDAGGSGSAAQGPRLPGSQQGQLAGRAPVPKQDQPLGRCWERPGKGAQCHARACLMRPGVAWKPAAPAAAAPLSSTCNGPGNPAFTRLPASAAGLAPGPGRDRSPAGTWPCWRKMPARLYLGCDGHPRTLASQCGLGHLKVPCPLQSPAVSLRLGALGTRHPAALPRAAAALQSPQPLPAVGRQRLPPGQRAAADGPASGVAWSPWCAEPCGAWAPASGAQEEQVAQADIAEDSGPLR